MATAEGAAAAEEEPLPSSSSGGLTVPHIPGRLTEAYDVQKAVGKGGYAIVYKGIRREDGRIIAVKKVEVSGQKSVEHACLATWAPCTCTALHHLHCHARPSPVPCFAVQCALAMRHAPLSMLPCHEPCSSPDHACMHADF